MKKTVKREFMDSEFIDGYVESKLDLNMVEFSLVSRGAWMGAWFSLYGDNKKEADRKFKNYMKGLDTLRKHIAIHHQHVQDLYDEYMKGLDGEDSNEFNAEKWKLENI